MTLYIYTYCVCVYVFASAAAKNALKQVLIPMAMKIIIIINKT
jgi:hypothetical protein